MILSGKICKNMNKQKSRVCRKEDKCKCCGTGHHLHQCLACGKKYRGYRKQNPFKAVCKSMQWQQQDKCDGKRFHDFGQKDGLHTREPSEQDQSFDLVRVKYINLDTVKGMIFTKIESTKNQR